MRRVLRLALRTAATLAALLVVAVVGLWVWADAPAGQRWIEARLVTLLADAVDGQVTFARVRGRLGRSVVVEDLRVRARGHTVARVDRVAVEYAVLPLLRRHVLIEHVILERPRVRAVHDPDGWRFPGPRHPRDESAAADGREPAVTVRRVEVRDGRFALGLLDATPPRRLAANAIDVVGRFAAAGGRTTVHVERLALTPRGIAVTPLVAAGEVVAEDEGIDIRGANVTTARSRLTADGLIEPGKRVEAEIVAGPLAAREARAALPGLDLPADLHARVRATGPWSGILIALRADLGAHGHVGGAARLDLAGSPRRYRIALGPSAWEDWEVRGLNVRGTESDGTYRARARVVTPEATLQGRTRVRVRPTLAYRARGRIEVPDLAAVVPSVRGTLATRFALHGHGTERADRQAHLDVAVTRGRIHGVELTRGVATVTLAGDTVTLGPAAVDAPGTRLTARATADLERSTLEGLAEVTADLGAWRDPELAGRVRLRTTIAGPFQSLTVTAAADGERLTRETVGAGWAHADFTMRNLGGGPPTGNARLDTRDVSLGTSSGHAASVALDWRQTPRGLVADLRALTLAPADMPSWQLSRPATLLAHDDGVQVDGLTLAAGEQRLALTGRIGTRASDAVLTLNDVGLDTLCKLTAGPPCSGALSGRARLHGSAAAPLLETALVAANVRVEQVEYGKLDIDGRYAARRLALRAVLRHPDAGEATVDGQVPVDLAWSGPRADVSAVPIALAVRADRLDLTFLATLAPGALRRTAGRLTVDLRLTGPWTALAADGSAGLEDGRLELRAAGIPYEDVTLDLRARGRSLDVASLKARAGDGTLTGSGHLALAPGAGGALGLRVRLEDFRAVRRPAYQAEVSGDLALNGTLARPVLEGKIDVVDALIRPTALPASGPGLDADPTIVVVSEDEAAGPPAPPEAEAPLVEAAGIDVRVHIARDAWIRRADANVELGGDLHLTRAPFEPLKVEGEIRLRRGWYEFQGRRFQIEEGRITFTGESPPVPTLDVTAVYKTREYRIEVHVEGEADKPRLTLRSDPVLDQADILAVLLFGRPSAELGRGQSLGLQRQAAALAAGYVMPELRESVMSTLGLDALDVELPSGTADEPGRVSVGRYVSGDIFLSLAQEFGARSAEVVSVEKDILRNVSVRGSTSTRGESAIDLIWRRRY